MPKVIFLTTLAPPIASLLTQHAPAGFDVATHPTHLIDAEKLLLVRDADFLILFPGILSEAVLRAATRLKLIQLVSAGYERLDLDLCRRMGIPVANNGGTNATDVAEHTVALILGLYRRLVEMDHNTRNDGWRAVDSGLCTYTIDGKTVGIVGLGNIGRRTARLLRAFGASLLYFDPFRQAAEVERALAVEYAPLEDLLGRADVVTLHTPLNAETHGLIGARELALMKPTAILVNTCRGPVVDETALTEALTARRIAGAGLDVLEKEPPDPASPLLRLDNVLLTPHTAGVTYDTWPRRGQFIFENLQRVWAGQPPLAEI